MRYVKAFVVIYPALLVLWILTLPHTARGQQPSWAYYGSLQTAIVLQQYGQVAILAATDTSRSEAAVIVDKLGPSLLLTDKSPQPLILLQHD